jgi:hypothetical protein
MKKLITIIAISLGLVSCSDAINRDPLKVEGEIVKLYQNREYCTAVIQFTHTENSNFVERVSFGVSCDAYKIGDKVKIIKL